MNEKQQEFLTIARRAEGLGLTAELEQQLQEYEPEYLRSFASETLHDIAGAPIEMFCVCPGDYRPHSSEKPTYRNRYCLFGAEITQHAWFRVLGYSPEEQLLHVLHWG